MRFRTAKAMLPLLFIGVGLLVWFINAWRTGTEFFVRPEYSALLHKGPLTTISFYPLDSDGALKDWSEKIFRGKTNYEIVDGKEEEPFLKAASEGTSSALYQKVKVDLDTNPYLVWEWKAVRFPSNKTHDDLGEQTENDFAARVYAVFEGHTVFTSEVIQYVWDDRFPEGEYAESGFSKNIKILVVESGLSENGEGWALEQRNLKQDYEMLYGKPPKKKLGAVAFMSDSDNTRTQSEAYFRFLKIVSPVDETSSRTTFGGRG